MYDRSVGRPRLIVCTASLLLACGSTPTPAAETPPAHPEPGAVARAGLRLHVAEAPLGTTVTIEASDNRTPLVAARPLSADDTFDVPEGFLVVVLRAGDVVRVLEFYAEASAEIQFAWSAADAPSAQGVEWLDRQAALQQAELNLAALMADRKDPAAMDAKLAAQRQEIEALGDTPFAHLSRLLHATLAIQLRDPNDAWLVLEPIPSDSIAWAAYSERMLELRTLFYGLAEAEARFAEVRAQVPDVGLQAALRAGDLLEAERAGGETEAAAAYAARMRMDGAPEVGKPMPTFSLVNFDSDKPLGNDDLAGAPYLMELWSTWCKPCVEDMPDLHALHADAGEALRIISIAVGDSRLPVVEFRRDRWPMPWTNVWAPAGAPIFAAWGTRSVPYAVLVDANGVVLRAGRKVRLPDVRAALALE